MAGQAVRYRLGYEGTDVQLLAEQQLEATVPPSVEIGEGERSGFWYELRDDEERVLYRRVLATPFSGEREVYDQETGAPSWVAAARSAGTLWLLVPSLPDARQLVLHGSPPEAGRLHGRPSESGRRAGAARELVRFDIGTER